MRAKWANSSLVFGNPALCVCSSSHTTFTILLCLLRNENIQPLLPAPFFRVTFLVDCFVILFAVDYPPPPRDQHRQAPVVQPGELRLNHWLLLRRPNKSSLNWQTTLSSKSWDRSWLWLSRQWIVSKTLVAILRKRLPTSQGRKSSGWYLFSVEVHSEVGT